jgi:hypothetical protein
MTLETIHSTMIQLYHGILKKKIIQFKKLLCYNWQKLKKENEYFWEFLQTDFVITGN